MMVAQPTDIMANHDHLLKLIEGVDAWADWRARHSKIVPDLCNADLSGEDLSGVDLRGANLSGAKLSDTILSQSRLDKAELTNAHFRRASLNGAVVTGASFNGARAEAANFSGADLSNVDFDGASLGGADFSGATLDGAKLTKSRLRDANFRRATLTRADFSSSNLHQANFEDTVVGTTIFGNNDLSAVRGLDTVQHDRPSMLDIRTIYRSKGNIPESFLRGCGVPDDFIVYMKSLAANPIEFYSCFISYSTKDQDFADRLYADLQNKGVRCWFAPHDVQGGRKLHEQIDEAIRLHDKLLLILSPHSMESEWVKTEIAKARKREVRDQRRVLFPIRLASFETLRDWECFDADTGKDSARDIREYFIPDFSHWKDHDSYREAFQRLIADLKSSDSSPDLKKGK
jgi:uncharacterized protein YjbI with pentapeptide repeats